MRRLLLTASVALACVTMARPADAQLPISFGPQGAYMTGLEEIQGGGDLNGTMGLGGRVALQPPLFPVGAVGQAVYYFPEGDGSYMTYGLGVKLSLPLPLISPYAIGGWQWRRSSGGGQSLTESGGTVGVGVQLGLGLPIFLEGTMEFNDEIPNASDIDVNPLIIQGGVLFGG